MALVAPQVETQASDCLIAEIVILLQAFYASIFYETTTNSLVGLRCPFPIAWCAFQIFHHRRCFLGFQLISLRAFHNNRVSLSGQMYKL